MLFVKGADWRPRYTAEEALAFVAGSVGKDWGGRRRGLAKLFRGGARSAPRSSRGVFGDATLGRDTMAPVLVPCYDFATGAPFVFSRADAVESDSFDFRLSEVCAATCAADGAAAAARSVDGRSAIAAASGAVVAMGNPTSAAITHVVHNKQEFPPHSRHGRHPRTLHRHRRVVHLLRRTWVEHADALALAVVGRAGARHRPGRRGHGRRGRRHGVRPRQRQQLRARTGQHRAHLPARTDAAEVQDVHLGVEEPAAAAASRKDSSMAPFAATCPNDVQGLSSWNLSAVRCGAWNRRTCSGQPPPRASSRCAARREGASRRAPAGNRMRTLTKSYTTQVVRARPVDHLPLVTPGNPERSSTQTNE